MTESRRHRYRVHKDCVRIIQQSLLLSKIKGSVFQTSGSANATIEQEGCQCHRALSRHYLNIIGYWSIISMNSGLIYQSNLNSNILLDITQRESAERLHKSLYVVFPQTTLPKIHVCTHLLAALQPCASSYLSTRPGA